ncbi:putative pectinesterase/pectinesterase inhibitor 35 [Tasmannia lanceolata]|uniref:putative pectinesterase/pectinesterase inhibitor 35 n=1 Tax=Tasmannia lanceolata TaxID=3420 RepID=UPI0040646A2D
MLSLTHTSTYERLSSKNGDRRKNFIFWASLIFLLVLVTPISCITIKLQATKSKALPSSCCSHFSHYNPNTRISRLIASSCKKTFHQEACKSSLLSFEGVSPDELFKLSVQFAMDQTHSALILAQNLNLLNKKQGIHRFSGVDDCIELLDDSLGQLSDVLDSKKHGRSDDIQSWLSAILTNQDTCMKGLNNFNSPIENDLRNVMANNLTKYISNSLALYSALQARKVAKENSGGRRLLSIEWGPILMDGFPGWVSGGDRKLLEASPGDMGARLIVAKDGSGTHMTIGEALAATSVTGSGRTVIYVKAGTYNENIKIPAKQKNVLLVGDGKGKTVITGNKNAADGYTTYESATLGVSGEGFMARDITIENSAGPAKHQAVALRIGSDKSVIYRCAIVGYQDTLYTLSNRQFYRESDIYGTVDFIFGNSAAVFQSCNINPRKPMSFQKNFITAQGRTDPNQNTGISIHNCRIEATSDLAPLKHKIPTFLGRPWMQYSRTVIMQSLLDDSIHPSGWSEWSSSSGLKTLYYGEYMNSGPGAGTSSRVNWPGYHAALSTEEASKFTVAQFIYGNLWLPSTGVAFDSGLL